MTELRQHLLSRHYYYPDILRLVQPERCRQHNNMVAAMDRVLLWAMNHGQG